MGRRAWLAGAALGGLAGLVTASVMTLLDWRLNPGGVFRGPEGTDWSVVVETAVSWLWPVALLVAAVAVALLGRLGRRG